MAAVTAVSSSGSSTCYNNVSIKLEDPLNTQQNQSDGSPTDDLKGNNDEPSVSTVSTDIQSYLAGFQKEIETPNATNNSDDENDGGDEDEGTYFVDQSGLYYYQAKGSNPNMMTVMTTAPGSDDTETEEFIISAENHDVSSTRLVSRNTRSSKRQSHGGGATGTDTDILSAHGSNQIFINSGNSFQKVTVVPAENSSEMSYVLIVQDPSDMKDDDETDVYDFDEGEAGEAARRASASGVIIDSDAEDDKSKILKIFPTRKTTMGQAGGHVTQVHMCHFCNYTSPKRYLLSRHMKSHSEERPHKCSVCERGFKTVASLQNHVNTHTGTKPHTCKFCDSAFTTSGELVRHVRYRHTHEKPHKCTECDYASVELSKLKRHIRCHTGERPYQCPHCTYASPDTFKLKRHLRIHTGEKPYECDICHTKFTQSNSLKAHKLTHNIGDKPVFHCEFCPTTCGRKTDLRIHIQKLHTSDKPLKCKRCSKAFPDRYSYKVHNKSHEGEKCYKCELCPYASISARHLESHMLIHTDQKPFHCHHCDQSFRQKQLLKRHQNLYHNPDYVPPPPREKTHECPECVRAFRHKGNLIRHMALHDPDPTVQRKQYELKIGRQKKIKIIDGQRVEVIPMMESDEDEEDEDEDEDDDDDGHTMHHRTVGSMDGEIDLVGDLEDDDDDLIVGNGVVNGNLMLKVDGSEFGALSAAGLSSGSRLTSSVIDMDEMRASVEDSMDGESNARLETLTLKHRGVRKQSTREDHVPKVEDDEDDDVEMMAMESADGQQYVVLEVIQLADGEEQAMVVAPGEHANLLGNEALQLTEHDADSDVVKALRNARKLYKSELEANKRRQRVDVHDVQNCFGFDDDEDDEEDEDGKDSKGKGKVTLLGSIS